MESRTLIDRIIQHGNQSPNRVAYCYLKQEQEVSAITNGQLLDQCRLVAKSLKKLGLENQTIVVPAQSDQWFPISFLACLYAGAIPVPIPYSANARAIAKTSPIINSCKPGAILAGAFTERSQFANYSTPILYCQEIVESFRKSEIQEVYPVTNPIAFIQYTSGSTSNPRGILVSQANLTANISAIATSFNYSSQSKMVCWLPLHHDMGLVGNLLTSLYVGFPLYFMSPASFVQKPSTWLRWISKIGATSAGGPNFAYAHCVQSVDIEEIRGIDLSSWETAYNGAEPIRIETLEAFYEKFRDYGFRKNSFFPCYGLAEATLMVSGGSLCQSSSEETNSTIKQRNGFVSCGKVVNGMDVKILSPEGNTEVSEGEEGEIAISGDSVCKIHSGRHDSVSETENANHLVEFGRIIYLRTGDLGFISDGELFVSGRKKDLIIIRGTNYYPQDIEVLVATTVKLAGPNSVAAIGIEENQNETLCLVLEATRELYHEQRKATGKKKFEEICSTLRSVIQKQFMLAVSRIVFVKPGTFPRTTSGKVQRSACKQSLLNRTLSVVHEDLIDAAVSQEQNSNQFELRLCEILSDAIKNATGFRRAITPDELLANIGIDSVSILSVSIEIEKLVGVAVSQDVILNSIDVRSLANVLASKTKLEDHWAYKTPVPSLEATAANYREEVRKSSSWDEHFRNGLARFQQFRDSQQYFFQTEIQSQSDTRVSVNGRSMLMMASYSYLGLIGHPKITAAVEEISRRFGSGVHGARLLSGTLSVHRDLETQIARWLNSEDAIIYSTGFVTNTNVIASLVDSSDEIVCDERIHASLVDGAKLSGATIRIFRHNDINHLAILLKQPLGRKRLVIVDSVYSMEGDIAPLPEIVALCKQFGCLLMVDEAHSLGVLGETGRGIQEYFNLPSDAIDIKMGTLSKAIPSSGGFIAGSKKLIDFLRHNSRGYIFSGAPTPTQTAAALAAFQILSMEPWRVARLNLNAKTFKSGLLEAGFRVPDTHSPIVPVIFPNEQKTLEAVAHCRENGLFVVPVFYPAVPRDAPRIRSTVLATHTTEDINHAIEILSQIA